MPSFLGREGKGPWYKIVGAQEAKIACFEVQKVGAPCMSPVRLAIKRFFFSSVRLNILTPV